MNCHKFLFLLIAASLAVGIFMTVFVQLPSAAFFFLLLVVLLFIVPIWSLRKGPSVWVALSAFFFLLGFLRGQLPDVDLLPDFLYSWSSRLLYSISCRLSSLGLSVKTEGLLQTMLLGQRELLTLSTKTLYRQAGASHILALSGLHLSVLFGLFNFWFLRLLHTPFRYPVALLGVLLMWGYVLLTNFPPSLCRASVMMSLLVIGQMRLVGNDAWHTLGLAAFLMLWVSPSSLFDIGFQLSFMAVAGLLLFYSQIVGLWQPRPSILRWMWMAWVVSFSAQLGVLPLLLHYFHQFSLSGLLLSPFYVLQSTAIMYAAMLLMLTGWRLLLPVVEGLVSVQHWTMSLSSFNLMGISFSWGSVTLLYTALLLLCPVLNAMQPSVQPSLARWARFFRLWPHLLAFLLLLYMAIMLAIF